MPAEAIKYKQNDIEMLQDQEKNEDADETPATQQEPDQRAVTGQLGFLITDDTGDSEALVQTLNEYGFQGVDAMERVIEAISSAPEGHWVIAYPNPVMVLAGEMDQGVPLQDAVVAWCAGTERLLETFRRDRRRITLLDLHAAQGNAVQLHRQLAARLSMAAPEGADDMASSPPAGDLKHLIAAQALREDPAAAMLAAELEAGTLPLGPAYRVDSQRISDEWLTRPSSEKFASLRETLETLQAESETQTKALSLREAEVETLKAGFAEREAAFGSLEEDNELLMLQLHQVQEELEVHYLENREFDARLDAVRADAEKARAEAKKAGLVRKSLREELQEARGNWKNERKTLTNRLKWATDDLAAIRQSLSWRVTAPLRRLAGIFTGGSRL